MKRTVSAVAVSALALTAGLVSTPATASASPASVSESVSVSVLKGMVFVQNDDPAATRSLRTVARPTALCSKPVRTRRVVVAGP